MGSQTFTQLPNSDFYEGGPPKKPWNLFIKYVHSLMQYIHRDIFFSSAQTSFKLVSFDAF